MDFKDKLKKVMAEYKSLGIAEQILWLSKLLRKAIV